MMEIERLLLTQSFGELKIYLYHYAVFVDTTVRKERQLLANYNCNSITATLTISTRHPPHRPDADSTSGGVLNFL